MYAQASPPVSSPYLPQPVPQRPYSNYDRFDAVPRPTSRPSGSPSRPPRGSPRPPVAPEQPYDEYTYDNGSPTPPDGDGDDFYASEPDFNDPQAYAAPSIATQSVRAPSPPSGPILDHSHLRPGNQAALLSHDRTLELYRANAKKTQDPDLQFEFAVFMIDASKTMPMPVPTPGNVMEVEKAEQKREDLIREAMALLKRLADRGHMPSQYFLADCYANGIGTHKSRQDFDRAFPLFVLAAKHGHPDAAYRAGTCCENGWGCRRESAKAIQFYKKSAAAGHPGALYRLGIAYLNGELGLSKSPREGVSYLKRSAEHATAEFPHALHELALLHERGIDNVLFVDYEYSAELLAQAAELGYAPSAYRLGECYEYGKMGCPQDPALSIHYYVSHRPSCSPSLFSCCLYVEHRCAAEPPRCLFRVDGMVSRWLARRPTAIRHGGVLVVEEGGGGGARKGNVRCRVLPRGGHWYRAKHSRVRLFVRLHLAAANLSTEQLRGTRKPPSKATSVPSLV